MVGISIAYIFFHLLPNLIHAQADIASTFNLSSTNAFQLIFATIFLGLIVFTYWKLQWDARKLNMALRKLQHEEMPETSFRMKDTNVFLGTRCIIWFVQYYRRHLISASQRFATTATAIIYLLIIGLHL